MSQIRLRILGESVIQVGETIVEPSATHVFALLLYLGIERGKLVSRSHALLVDYVEAAEPADLDAVPSGQRGECRSQPPSVVVPAAADWCAVGDDGSSGKTARRYRRGSARIRAHAKSQ